MSEVSPALAALFGLKPKGATRPFSTPSKPAGADFFAMLAAQKATPKPAVLAAKPTATVDIRQAATAALDQVGWFAGAPGAFGVAGVAPTSPFARVSRPAASAGLFRGIVTAGRKPRVKKDLNRAAPSLKDLFKLNAEPEFHPSSKMAEVQRRRGVGDSYELKRILAVPRRPPALDTAPDLTEEFRKPGGAMKLWPVQSAALDEARKADGLFGPVGVGQGKTLITLLMAAALNAKQAVILVPPSLRAQLLGVDIPRLSKEWKVPLRTIRVVAYSQLSNAASADILEELKPDLIVADECHALRHRDAARTKRFLRYMKANPRCRFVGLSGTVTRRSLKDYQHLAELALRKNSPVPNHFPTLAEWCEALDVSDDPMPPGALFNLCSDEDLDEIAKLSGEGAMQSGTSTGLEVQKVVRGAFRRRLVETPGVVATEESAIGTSLVINAVRPLVPFEVTQELTTLRTRWEIGGEELTDALAVARVARQLAAGFYYRWAWPNGVVDVEWMEARREWGKEMREILRMSKKGLDSPFLVTNAIERGEYHSEAYAVWRTVKDRPVPPTEAVWISDFLVRAAIDWAKENAAKTTPAILWYTHSVIGERLAKDGGFPLFGPGAKASQALTEVDVKKTPVIVASVASHGTGKNLQMFSLNLFTTPMPGGVEWEQAVARTHRPGQLADEVRVDTFVHTAETEGAFRNAVRDAQYIEQTQGQRQKLNYAEKLGFKEGAFNFSGAPDEHPETDGINFFVRKI